MHQIKNSGKQNKKTLDKKQNEVVILGDSHASGCAQEVQHNTGLGFEFHGTVKLGANTEIIVKRKKIN